MNLPVYLSVAKATALVSVRAEQTHRLAAEDRIRLQSFSTFIRPFVGVWYSLLHASRRVQLFGYYFVLMLAWSARVTAGILAVGAVVFIVALACGGFDSSNSSGYVPSLTTSTDPYSHTEIPNATASSTPSNDYIPSAVRAPSTDGYTPRVSIEDVSEISQRVYDYALQQKMVDVNGYDRGQTYVQPYQRQPPGGFTLEDKANAGGLAVGAAALIYGADYLSQKYDQWSVTREAEARKKTEAQQRADKQGIMREVMNLPATISRMRQQRADKQRIMRETEEREKLQKKKSWWQR